MLICEKIIPGSAHNDYPAGAQSQALDALSEIQAAVFEAQEKHGDKANIHIKVEVEDIC